MSTRSAPTAATELLLTRYPEAANTGASDSYAWLCNVLAHHGGPRYARVLATVERGTDDPKLKKFAAQSSDESRLWNAILNPVLRHPLVAAVAAGGALIALAAPALHMHTSQPGPQTFSKSIPVVKVYDEAYEAMTKQGDPIRFRDFLLQAPRLFNELGDRLGAIDHVISFWRFRFPQGKKVLITPEELADIFADFEQSLAREEV